MKNKVMALLALIFTVIALAGVPAQAAPRSDTAPPKPRPAGVKVQLGETITGGNSAKLKEDRGVGPRRSNRATRATSCPSGCHMYAGVWDDVNPGGTTPIAGMGLRYEIEDPAVRSWDTFSLMEQAVADWAGTGLNAVGVGWVENIALFGDNKPRFFVESYTDGGFNGWGTGFTYFGSAPITHGQDLTSMVADGVGIRTYWEHFDNTGCPGCAGWSLFYAKAVGAPLVGVGYYPDSLWPTNTFTGAEVDQVQGYGETLVGQTPSQSHMSTGSILNRMGSSAYSLSGGSAPAPDWDTTLNATDQSKWTVTKLSATTFSFGGPGGFDDIQSTTSPSADDCPGEGTGTNPSGWGAICLYDTSSGAVPQGKLFQIDSNAGTTCRANLGGTGVSNISLTGVKKATVFSTNNCTGTGLQVNHGRITLPSPYTNAAAFSYRVDSAYATCATNGTINWPTYQPTC